MPGYSKLEGVILPTDTRGTLGVSLVPQLLPVPSLSLPPEGPSGSALALDP